MILGPPHDFETHHLLFSASSFSLPWVHLNSLSVSFLDVSSQLAQGFQKNPANGKWQHRDLMAFKLHRPDFCFHNFINLLNSPLESSKAGTLQKSKA